MKRFSILTDLKAFKALILLGVALCLFILFHAIGNSFHCKNYRIKIVDIENYPNYEILREMDEWQLDKILMFTGYPDISLVHDIKCKKNVSYQNAIDSYKTTKVRVYEREDKLLKEKYPELYNPFHPILTADFKRDLLDVAVVFVSVAKAHKVPYFLADGSLIGYLRFKDINPWDDDVDFLVSLKYWKELALALSCVDGFELIFAKKMRFTFFKRESKISLNNKRKKYPFVDIFFYDEDNTYIWRIDKVNRAVTIGPRDAYFPSKVGKMMGIKMTIPKDPVMVSTLLYGDLDKCTPQVIIHNSPKHRLNVSIPCSLLYKAFGNFSIHN